MIVDWKATVEPRLYDDVVPSIAANGRLLRVALAMLDRFVIRSMTLTMMSNVPHQPRAERSAARRLDAGVGRHSLGSFAVRLRLLEVVLR